MNRQTHLLNRDEGINQQLPGEEIPLSEFVERALKQYLLQMDGHPVSRLYALVIQEVEKPLIQTVLDYTQHNQTRAAQILGVSRSTLRKKIVQYRLETSSAP